MIDVQVYTAAQTEHVSTLLLMPLPPKQKTLACCFVQTLLSQVDPVACRASLAETLLSAPAFNGEISRGALTRCVFFSCRNLERLRSLCGWEVGSDQETVCL